MVKKQENIAEKRFLGVLTLAREQTSVDSPCPDPEKLALLVEGRLTDSEREEMQHHLASCLTCYENWLSVAAVDEHHKKAGKIKISYKRIFGYSGTALAAAASLALYLNLQHVEGEKVMTQSKSIEMHTSRFATDTQSDPAPVPPPQAPELPSVKVDPFPSPAPRQEPDVNPGPSPFPQALPLGGSGGKDIALREFEDRRKKNVDPPPRIKSQSQITTLEQRKLRDTKTDNLWEAMNGNRVTGKTMTYNSGKIIKKANTDNDVNTLQTNGNIGQKLYGLPTAYVQELRNACADKSYQKSLWEKLYKQGVGYSASTGDPGDHGKLVRITHIIQNIIESEDISEGCRQLQGELAEGKKSR